MGAPYSPISSYSGFTSFVVNESNFFKTEEVFNKKNKNRFGGFFTLQFPRRVGKHLDQVLLMYTSYLYIIYHLDGHIHAGRL